jgi:hypothetical protein
MSDARSTCAVFVGRGGDLFGKIRCRWKHLIKVDKI